MQRFLAPKNMAVVSHPPYSPDLAPCDFFLFQRMKSKLKGCRFQDVTEIREQSLTVPYAIPKSQLQRCFQQKRWTRCINLEGDTLKGTATSRTKGKRVFHYRLTPETYQYTLVYQSIKKTGILYKMCIYILAHNLFVFI
jgi:hypothetical protein